MRHCHHLSTHAHLLKRAESLLGEKACAVGLGWSAEQTLGKQLTLVERAGISGDLPLLVIEGGPKGVRLECGIELFELTLPQVTLRVAHVVAPGGGGRTWRLYNFWAVPIGFRRAFYRQVRRLERDLLAVLPPVMREPDRQRLWENSIGFLRRARQTLRKFGVPQKRGLLLLGEPGNGKTMACRWLCALCNRHGLRFKSVSAPDYLEARSGCDVHDLFELDGPGIILFDDLDQAIADRDEFQTGLDRTTFLTELDGLRPREGIVYLFTSNARLGALDPAFRRPGRIDVFVQFSRPDAALRERFVRERWHAEIVSAVDVGEVVRATEGLSFAEMDELKKLLVVDYLDNREWNWPRAWLAWCAGHDTGRRSHRIGFTDAGSRPRSHERPPASARF
jgi:hypothetical protein